MGLETVTNGRISELVDTNPVASDKVNKGDDHIRNIKKVLKDTFSGINAENGVGDNLLSEPVTANSRELNILDGATLTTDELNILDGATLDTDDLNILDGATIDTTTLNLLSDLKSGVGIVNIFDTIYPTGSIYMSTASADPSTLFPNTTWAVFGEGKVLVGYDQNDSDFSAGNTGGSKTHTLTVDEMPEHTHKEHMVAERNDMYVDSSLTTTVSSTRECDVDGTSTTGTTTFSTGGSQAHNNLQPYVTVYMWTRTA
jgi:hypothetical protein